MVKSNYTPVKQLDDQTKDIKVKVKVISKGDPKQTPPKKDTKNSYFRMMRTNRVGVEEHGVIGEVVRCCGLCQQLDVMLKRKPVRNERVIWIVRAMEVLAEAE